MKRRTFDAVSLIVPAAVVLVWFATTTFGGVPAYKLPSPQRVLRVFLDFATGCFGITPFAGTLLVHLLYSLSRVLSGFLLAAVFGITLGFLTGRVSLLRRLLDPFVGLLRSIPGIGWLPIAIVWFGVGEGNTRFLITLAAFFPIYLNTMHAAASVPALSLRAGRMLGAKGVTLFRTVVFPSAFPGTVVGLRLGLGISWAYLVLGEVTGVTQGLGAVMTDGRMLGHVDIVLVTMAVIALAGKLTDWLLCRICRLLRPQISFGGTCQ